jgi:HEXXH motif-containing protein
VVSARPDHRISRSELRSLAVGEFPLPLIRRLRAAELSKNLLLVTALRQELSRLKPPGTDLVESASGVLADVQLSSPDAVAEVMRLPHLSMWAADGFSRLRAGRHAVDPMSAIDLAPLGAFAAVAALRARHPFELRLPIRNGMVTFPGLGRATIGPLGHSGWATIRSEGNSALITSADAGELQLPADFDAESSRYWPNWTPVSRVQVEADGLILGAIIDVTDSFLARLGPVDIPGERTLESRLAAAWEILARHHRPVAAGLATVLTTLVPLAEAPTGRPNSATSGWAWGAIGLSLIDDEALLAETLAHEFHHLMLAAVEDLTPLAESGTADLHYVAWRDDPRPAAAIMHGTYAQCAVTGFWRGQRPIAGAADRNRCDIELARARRAALAGAKTLDAAPSVTESGLVMVGSMRDRLEKWQHERLSAQAESVAAEIAAEHYLRWRVAHLRPDEQAVRGLASRWLNQEARAAQRPQPSVTLIPWNRNPSPELGDLLELAYRDAARLSNLRGGPGGGIATAHLALLSGDDVQAKAGYLSLILADGSIEAWIGLMLARRRLSGVPWSFPISGRPEIAVAVQELIRTLSGAAASSESLVEWLLRD